MNNAYTKILLFAALLLGGCAENEPAADATMHEIAVGPAIASSESSGEATSRNEATTDAANGASRATPITSLGDVGELQVCVKRNGTGQDYFSDVATSNGSIFSFSTPHYWLPGAPLDFYAYTPSPHVSAVSIAGGAVNFSYSGSVEGVTTDGADILTGAAFGLQYADTQAGVVPMKMNHALALIEFAVAYEDDAEGNRTSKIGNDIIITGVALHNLSRDGSCKASMTLCDWTPGNQTEWIEADFTRTADADEQVDFVASDGTAMCGLRVGRDIFAGDLINIADRSKALIVVPGQTLSEMRVSFVEGSPAIYSKAFPIEPIRLQPGKYYRFYLSIKSNNVSVWSTLVTDWIEADGGEYTLQ